MKLTFFSDPAHGWLKVPETMLLKYCTEDEINSISSYSYHLVGGFVFLEEDRDITIFINAVKRAGKEIEFNDYSSEKPSKVRSYQSFTPILLNKVTVGNSFIYDGERFTIVQVKNNSIITDKGFFDRKNFASYNPVFS